MQANLFKVLTRNSVLVISSRAGHINHPGHKPRKRIIEPKYELPDEYVKDEPAYPPVKPQYPPGTFNEHIKPSLAWHYYEEGEKFHSLKTIQERMSVMAYLNIQSTLDDIGKRRIRHYPLHLVSALPAAVRTTQFNQYITKTHLAEKDSLAQFPASDKAPISKELYAKIKESVADCILTSLIHKKDSNEKLWESFEDPAKYKPKVLEFEKRVKMAEEKSDALIRDIFDSVTTILASQPEFAYLKEAQYGKNVNIQAYWKRCGYKSVKPRGAVYPDGDTIRYQFRDKASYQIKLANPLKPVSGFLFY